MKEYERLTKRTAQLGVPYSAEKLFDIIERLAELETKIENGTLIELPCKVGKILYEVCEKPNDNLFVKLPSEFFIVEHRVCDIQTRMLGKKPIFAIFTSNKEFGIMAWDGEHIGSQLLLTKAEAEKKLKELQGE